MKAAELRIGNWIKVKANVFTNDSFSKEKCNEHHISDLISNNCDYSYEPIPLTKEWLVKFGFVKEVDWLELTINQDIIISYENEIIYLSVGSYTQTPAELKHIKHLHHLQNLYHALTGKELNTESP